ncbi:hypothetical protein EBT31_03450 [bacterium]|nr:hypothetical protein [bacterium]
MVGVAALALILPTDWVVMSAAQDCVGLMSRLPALEALGLAQDCLQTILAQTLNPCMEVKALPAVLGKTLPL